MQAPVFDPQFHEHCGTQSKLNSGSCESETNSLSYTGQSAAVSIHSEIHEPQHQTQSSALELFEKNGHENQGSGSGGCASSGEAEVM